MSPRPCETFARCDWVQNLLVVKAFYASALPQDMRSTWALAALDYYPGWFAGKIWNSLVPQRSRRLQTPGLFDRNIWVHFSWQLALILVVFFSWDGLALDLSYRLGKQIQWGLYLNLIPGIAWTLNRCWACVPCWLWRLNAFGHDAWDLKLHWNIRDCPIDIWKYWEVIYI